MRVGGGKELGGKAKLAGWLERAFAWSKPRFCFPAQEKAAGPYLLSFSPKLFSPSPLVLSRGAGGGAETNKL